ncbi:MAG TPA: RNase adapter RapZ [Terriglobales bacterium]|nr:RNase adapter RapZ [Terriglobales bacterium]
MPSDKRTPGRSKAGTQAKPPRVPSNRDQHELVIISGMSGAGKASALKTFEDLGYYCVDNLPVGLITNFAELVLDSLEIQRAALVVDIREGARLDKLPQILASLRRLLKTTFIFLEADEEALLRRYSETRRPHPLGRNASVRASLVAERRRLQPVKAQADLVVDTTKFNVHELRAMLTERFQRGNRDKNILISCVSFGYREGVPEDADLVFDVRFLPNPHFIPKFRPLTGRDAAVAKYIRSFPQTREFIRKISELLVYLIPHYIEEGKSYLTIAFGCTGGKHRSVMIAEDVQKRLGKAGYTVKVAHRDSPSA